MALPENKGLGNALRIAIDKCSYELIARMDSDDIAIKTRFEEQLSFLLSHSEIDIVGGNIAEFVGTPDNITGKRIVPETQKEIDEYIKKTMPIQSHDGYV